MDILSWTARGRQMQAMRDELQGLKATVHEQALVINDVTTVTNLDTKYKGNAYTSYEEAVEELTAKYEGTAEWGVLQTGNIIDLRAAFIAGAGVKVYPKDKKTEAAKAEMDFVQAFLEANNLDREMVQDFAKEAELEGRFLAELKWDKDKEQVVLRFMAWTDLGYKIETAEGDYAKYEKATWDKDGKRGSLEADRFVYARFGGRLNSTGSPYPKVGKCLTQIDDLDKALRDWREINNLFAAPVPDFEYADQDGKGAERAKKGNEAANKINFKLKKMFHHTGAFNFKSAPMDGAQSLENEIVTKAKMISGTTGVPVQFLGLPDIASVRSSESTNTAELVSAATQKERLIWKGFYQEAITKAIAIWNKESGKTTLDPTRLVVDIPYITADHWARIRDIWLPLYTASAISLEALLAQLPGIDADAELKAKEERTANALEDFNREAADDDEGEDDDDDGPVRPAKDRPQGKGDKGQGRR